FVYFYRHKSKFKRITIGTASNDANGWTLSRARSKAHMLRVTVDSGVDPAEESRKADATAQDAKTFRETIDAYLAARQPNMKPRSFEETKRHLENHWKPFHKKLVHEITTDMVIDRLVEIGEESGATTRNRVRSTLSALFAWTIGNRFSKRIPS